MRILIAGVGNILRGDDGFGVRVVQRLEGEPMPECVHIIEVGISGISLVRELMEKYDGCILVDCVDRRARPGTLFVLEHTPAPELLPIDGRDVDMHAVDPSRALLLAQALGLHAPRTYIVACQPGNTEELTDSLTEPVSRAVDGAIGIIRRLVDEMSGSAAL